MQDGGPATACEGTAGAGAEVRACAGEEDALPLVLLA